MGAWRSRLPLLGVVCSLFLSACGSSGATSGTTYWRANFEGGTSLYMSVVRGGESVSGWAKYGDGSFQHYVGNLNSDGTYSISAYGGSTLKIEGNAMTVTTEEGQPDHYVSVGESEYKAAGGPA
jgi:hypothetical protein